MGTENQITNFLDAFQSRQELNHGMVVIYDKRNYRKSVGYNSRVKLNHVYILLIANTIIIKLKKQICMAQQKINGGSKQSEIDQYDVGDLSQEIQPRNFGAWNEQEQQKYIIFLQSNRKIFQNRHDRKKTKIFKLMSQFLQTRTGIQCRSHHMKQMRVNRNKVRNIINSYKKNHLLEIPPHSSRPNSKQIVVQNNQPNHREKNKEQYVKLEEKQEQKGMAKASGYSWANKFLSRESFTGFYGHLFVLFDENQQGPYFQPMIFYPN